MAKSQRSSAKRERKKPGPTIAKQAATKLAALVPKLRADLNAGHAQTLARLDRLEQLAVIASR